MDRLGLGLRSSSPRLRRIVVAWSLLLWGFSTTTGQDKARSEWEVKAGCLYNFVLYTRWPRSAFSHNTAPFEVAVVGKDLYQKKLDEVFRRKKFGHRPIVVRRYPSADKVRSAQVVVLGPMPEEERLRLFQRFQGKPTLLVGSDPEDIALGAHARLYLKGRRVAFTIHSKAVQAAGLRMSSKLLQHAEIWERRR